LISSAVLTQSHRLLNRARLIAEAPAARQPDVRASARPLAPGHSTPHGKQHKHSRSESAPPPGALTHEVSTLDAIHTQLETAYKTGFDATLIAATERAGKELDELQHGPSDREPETKEQFRFRICEDYVGKSARFVADRENISPELVRKIRTEDGRDARGLKVES
jgi:hypothetical protein